MRRIGALGGLFFAVVIAMAMPAWSAPAQPATPAAAPTDTTFENTPFLRPDKATPVVPTDPVAVPHPSGFDPTRVMLALMGVLGLIFLLRGAAKRYFPGVAAHRGSRAIKVLSRCTISPRQHLLLVQVGKRLLVVGDCGTQLNPLCEISDESETAALIAQLQEETIAAAWRFDSLFGRARKGFESAPADETTEIESTSPAAPAEAPFDATHELNDPSLAATQKELEGLSDKVRNLTRQLGNAS